MEYRYREASEMKDSGVEWIGNIPKDWEICKVKYLCNIKSGEILSKTYFEDKGIYPIYGSNGIIGRTNKKNNSNKAIIIGRVGACGEVNIAKEGWITDNALILGINYRKVNFSYMAYVLKSCNLKDLSSGTAQPLITGSQIKNIQVLSIDIKKQEKIANFLDKKTSQFDSIISKKEALIEKLEEAKKILISEVVTGKVKVVKTDDGYELVKRSSDEMKDSGVEWLGDIPKDWEVKKIKHVITEPLKYGANESAELDDRKLPRYIRITDFKDNGELKDETFKSLPFEKAKGYYLKEGDILFARSGATVGKTFLFENYTGKACFAGYLIKATPNKTLVNPNFLYSFTKSKGYENWKNSIFMQATIQNIGADKYKELKFALPTIEEQILICKYMMNYENRIKKLIDNTKLQIEKLKEAKQSLISEAVTGKIEILD